MTSQYPAAIKYLQAKGFTSGRPGGRPLWIIQHTMEAHELGDTAEGTANYFHTLPDGRQVSSHLCIDNNSAIQCVDVTDSAWTVGNSAGNHRGLNYENAGYANQSAAQWTDAYSIAMLTLNAKCAKSDVLRYAIPVRRCTVDQLKSYQPGFTTHNDMRIAFGHTTHTDPGSNFPWSRYLDMVRAELKGTMRTLTWQHVDASLPILKYGDADGEYDNSDTAWVTRVQRYLQVTDDGKYGDQTKAAIKALGVPGHDGSTVDMAVWEKIDGLWGAADKL